MISRNSSNHSNRCPESELHHTVGIIHYGIIAITHTTIHSNVYGTISISRVRRAVGTFYVIYVTETTI